MPLNNIGTPQVANRALLPLAIEAGLLDLVRYLVPIAVDKRTLLERIIEALEQAVAGNPHPCLNMTVFQEVLEMIRPGDVYNAINVDTLDRLLEIVNENPKAPVMEVKALPKMALVGSPPIVKAGRDRQKPTQVNVVFSAPPADAKYEIYLDLQLALIGNKDPDEDGYVYERLLVPEDGKRHSVRVLFNLPENRMTPFGPPAFFS